MLSPFKALPRTFHARDRTLELGDRTLVMGIINVTPDSFSDGGETFGVKEAVERALEFDRVGVDIIDIGGMSTRPGSQPVDQSTELHRVMPVIKRLAGKVKCLLSIDTYRAEVAREALEGGVHIVNDISACNFDPQMPEIISRYNAGAVLMHIKGTPRDMQFNPEYDDLISEIYDYLAQSVNRLNKAGCGRESILVDPGIGFGKTLQHNLQLIRCCYAFSALASGVLIGPSRKSFIGALTGQQVNERFEGTLAAVCACVCAGADVVRVHDCARLIPALQVMDAIVRGS